MLFRSEQAARDVVQETYLRALRSIGSFRWTGPASVESWLVTIARNLLVDRSRAAARVPVPAGLPAQWRDQPTAPPADAAVVRADEDRQLLAAVLRLPTEQRETVVLRFVMEWTIEATARAMGRTVGAVKALQYRAVRALQQQLNATRPPTRPRLSTGPGGRLAVHRVRTAR